ncbi:unnamed protein product [Polarella glacialis]|uniref:C3H1-type domain-containing protein n=1 Tax=Polarella glacialis TaxID=89957 RepID=A0A813I6S5_POLGL|nr:unnamed protein product [Polarella glacialis]
MASGPPWVSDRPRRAGAARREQELRAQGRSIQRFLRAIDALDSHRGCRPTSLGAALAQVLRSSRPHEGESSRSRVCWHWEKGHCSRGASCGFAHSQLTSGAGDGLAPDTGYRDIGQSRCEFNAGAAEFVVPSQPSHAVCAAAASGFTPQGASASSLQNQGLEFAFNVHAPTFQPIPLLHSDAAVVSDSEDGPAGQITRDVRTSGISVQTFAGTLAPKAVAPSSTPGVHTQLGPGSRVQVQGLQNRQEMNGQFGQLMHFDEAKMRWAVELECGTKVLLKPGNLLPPAKEPSHYSIDDSSSEGSAESEFWGWPAGAGEEGVDMAKEIVESVQVPVARSASSDEVRRMILGEMGEYLRYLSETVGGDTFVQYVEKGATGKPEFMVSCNSQEALKL